MFYFFVIFFRDSNRESYITAECASCILDVSTKYFKIALSQNNRSDFTQEMAGIHQLIQQLDLEFCPEASPQEIAQRLFKLAAETGGVEDPWKGIRDQSNEIALKLLTYAESSLSNIYDPKERLFEAILWSITGNNIDFGTAGHEVNLDTDWLLQMHNQFKSEGFRISDFDNLWEMLQTNPSLLYLCDNAGEIAFDKLVISEICALGINVTAVVKGGPISNDAIYDDAVQVGLDQVCSVITTGSADLGFYPYGNSSEFMDILKQAPLVITKGQANWECVYAYQDQLPSTINFFVIAKLKCNVHASLFGFPKGSNILYHIDMKDFRI
jgi:hypothetical protein